MFTQAHAASTRSKGKQPYDGFKGKQPKISLLQATPLDCRIVQHLDGLVVVVIVVWVGVVGHRRGCGCSWRPVRQTR